jgi:hypothetical protein
VSELKRPSAQTLQWTAGESNPDFLVASQASSRLTSSPGWRVQSPRSKVQSRKDKENASAAVFCFLTLDLGPSPTGELTEVGVEPTKSRRSRHRRFPDLRTRSWLVFLLFHRSISSRSGCRTRHLELMRLHWALAPLRRLSLASSSDQGESRTPKPIGHDVLSVACLPVAPLGR